MSSKSKLIIGIVLLAVGGGLIPTGILTNDYLRDAVYDGVPDALLQIKDEAVSEIQEMVPILATPSVLVGARDEVIENIKSMVAIAETPGILRDLKTAMEAEIPNIINFATEATLINFSISWLTDTYGFDAGSNIFFNDPTFVDPYTGIPGLSAWAEFPLDFTLTARTNMLYVGWDDPYVATFPGIIVDTTMGTGAWGFHDIAYYVSVDGGDPYTNPQFLGHFNITLTQCYYMWEYLWGLYNYGVIDLPFYYQYGIDIADARTYGFYMQWANVTFISDGIDLGIFMGLDSELKGFEAGVPTPTNIPLANSMALWDDTNPLSFANDTGIYAWLDGTVKASTFGLDDTQFAMVLGWLNNFITNVASTLIEYDQGVTMDQIGEALFFEQWTNGTIQGEAKVPDGVLAELSDEFEGPPYFEVGLPDPSNISVDAVEDLWDEYNKLSFANGDGFEVWLGATDNTTLQALITDEFNITSAEFALLADWLVDFMNTFTVVLLEWDTGLTLAEFAFNLFYEQWANGTMNGEEVIPDGFLSMRDPPIIGPPYFELGIEYASGITMEQTEDLWLIWDEYSLVTVSGINMWYKAKEGNEAWVELSDHFGLNRIQMIAITTWLPEFRDTLVNELAADEMNLPMEPYDLGNTLFLTLLPVGSVLAALGVVVLILSRRS